MKFETKNLKVFPLTYIQLIAYIKNNGTLEKLLNLKTSRFIVPEELIPPLKQISILLLQNPEKYLFKSIWIIIHKEKKQIAGSLLFIGNKRKGGFYEIGYGTESDFQNQGIMTETIGGLIDFLAVNKKINGLVAKTLDTNQASMNVLKNNGFELEKTKKNLLYWKRVF